MSKLKKPNRFEPSQINDGSLKIPRTALRFAADVQIDESAEASAESAATIPISLRARSGNVLNHWFFGRCVHDFAGMRPASAKLPFDYCHRDDEVLGFSDSQDVTDGLVMHGVLIPFKDQDRVDEVVTKAAAGFEWQGSIYFDADDLILEYVPEGMTSPVNGGMFEGPGVIFREWMLRGAAICPYGYDPNTSAQFSQSGDEVAISFQESSAMAIKPKSKLSKAAPNRHDRRKAAALAANGGKQKGKLAKPTKLSSSKPKPKTKLAAEEEDDEEELEGEAEELEAEEEDDLADDGTETEEESDCDCEGEEGCDCDKQEDSEAEPVEGMEADEEEGKQSAKAKLNKGNAKAKLSPAQKEAQRFVTAFGPQGGVWFAQGLTFAAAQSRFNKAMQKENADLQQKVSKLTSQLNAMGGEDEPVSSTPAEERGGKGGKSKLSNGLTSGAAKFAASMKIRR